MADKQKDSLKRCFVICPIGERDSDIRARSDDLFNFLIQPVALEAGYRAYRVIDNDRPGDITAKIVGDIIESDAVVCDITGHNPNVFYELAIAHAWKKPCILISGEDPVRVPFDIGSQNVIQIVQGSFGAVHAAKDSLARHFAAFSKGEGGSDNPVGRYERGQELKESGNPLAVTVNELQAEISELRTLFREEERAREQKEDEARRRRHVAEIIRRRQELSPKHWLDTPDGVLPAKRMTDADSPNVDVPLLRQTRKSRDE